MRQAQRLPRLGRASGARRRGRRAEGGGAPSMTPSMPTSLPSRILLRAAASLCSASDLSARARRPAACQPARPAPCMHGLAAALAPLRRLAPGAPARGLFRSPPQGCAWMPHRELGHGGRAAAAAARRGAHGPGAPPGASALSGAAARVHRHGRAKTGAGTGQPMGTRGSPGSLGAGRPGRHGRRGGRAGTGARGRARARTHAGL